MSLHKYQSCLFQPGNIHTKINSVHFHKCTFLFIFSELTTKHRHKEGDGEDRKAPEKIPLYPFTELCLSPSLAGKTHRCIHAYFSIRGSQLLGHRLVLICGRAGPVTFIVFVFFVSNLILKDFLFWKTTGISPPHPTHS